MWSIYIWGVEVCVNISQCNNCPLFFSISEKCDSIRLAVTSHGQCPGMCCSRCSPLGHPARPPTRLHWTEQTEHCPHSAMAFADLDADPRELRGLQNPRVLLNSRTTTECVQDPNTSSLLLVGCCQNSCHQIGTKSLYNMHHQLFDMHFRHCSIVLLPWLKQIRTVTHLQCLQQKRTASHPLQRSAKPHLDLKLTASHFRNTAF